MEILSWVVLVLIAVVGGLAYYFLRDGKVSKEEINQAIEDATEVVENIVEEVRETVAEVTDAVEEVKKPKLPTNKTLEKKTKSEIEKFALEFGIELDMRMTKANMIKDLRSKYNQL